jgi:uncharacterized protein YbjT (DUF2867 family)
MKKVLVMAAGGRQGKLLIPKLAAAGMLVRAARATAGKDDELRRLGADEVAVGDFADVDLYTKALDGCDAVYHIGPAGNMNEKHMGFAMIEAAKRCRTRHVVLSSVYHTVIDILQHRYKRDIEEKLFESGLNCTVLRPCDYMMTELHITPVLHAGHLPVFYQIKAGRRGSLIDVEDLTEVAAKVLIEGDKHFFADYELAGTDKLSPHEMARILSRVVGREVPVVQSTVDEVFQQVTGARTATTQELKHFHAMLTSIANWYSQHEAVGNPNVLEWLLGRNPTTFEQFARRVIGRHRAEQRS